MDKSRLSENKMIASLRETDAGVPIAELTRKYGLGNSAIDNWRFTYAVMEGSEWVQLGLPDVPVYITEVNVPSGTELYVGRIGSQPEFGLMGKSGFQYQTIGRIPENSFVNTRPILEPEIRLNMGH